MKPSIWWGEGKDLRCGRIAGRVTSGGWKWKISSEGAIWLWLNREGDGLVWGEKDRFILKPGMYAMTGGGNLSDWSCVRYPGSHLLEVVVISRDWLRERLGKRPEWLHPALAKWLQDGSSVAFCGLMGIWEKELSDALARAAMDVGPARLLAEARILEWAAVRLFRSGNSDGGGFCSVLRDRDPVKRAIQLLAERLDQPLDLSAVAQEVGVAPHHLSRRVSVETGMTLQRHLRRLRIERACALPSDSKIIKNTLAKPLWVDSLGSCERHVGLQLGRIPRRNR